ncbi:hypothetical protein Gotri_006411 [Gossypium trilobum]|uniref:Uncharacterized protein n=1 Tax=Gossypium trilobum TaxID=34281 RepID=A0A7J9F072_9ROSI|nr:hypothetical protein [Gossypium trilobum]
MLNLTYDNDKEQCYYDICEQERDPNFWATLNALIVVSFARKMLSSVKSLHAIILLISIVRYHNSNAFW